MIGLLLGATIMAPVAAQAQERERGGGRQFDRQQQQVDRPQRGPEARAAIVERRMDRPETPRPQMQPQAQPAQPAQRAEGRQWQRGDRDWNRGGDSSARAEAWRQRRDAANAAAAARPGDDRRADARRDWHRDRGDDDRRDWNRDRDNDRSRNWVNERRDGNRDGRNDRNWSSNRSDWNGRAWDRDWRNDRRYSWQDYRRSNRGIYHLPRYSPPRWGYSYRRWTPGYRFDPWYYGSSYWLDDPWAYRLPPAYGDYRWIRYYDDVALVDIRTGLIADIIYSFFL